MILSLDPNQALQALALPCFNKMAQAIGKPVGRLSHQVKRDQKSEQNSTAGVADACLGKSAKSAIQLGYSTLCVQDATFEAFASKHVETLRATGYHHIMATLEFEEYARSS